jgi:hypothetical protein
MNCPPEIGRLLLELLKLGTLRIRALGWSGDATRCAVEADHIHNLPSLLTDYSPEGLSYYWEAERTSFAEQSSPADLELFEPMWQELARHVPVSGDHVAASAVR